MALDIEAIRVDIAHHYKAKTRHLVASLCDEVEAWVNRSAEAEAAVLVMNEELNRFRETLRSLATEHSHALDGTTSSAWRERILDILGGAKEPRLARMDCIGCTNATNDFRFRSGQETAVRRCDFHRATQ